MKELEKDELNAVSGGAPLAPAVICAMTAAFLVGVYNGYQEAKRADQKK